MKNSTIIRRFPPHQWDAARRARNMIKQGKIPRYAFATDAKGKPVRRVKTFTYRGQKYRKLVRSFARVDTIQMFVDAAGL